MKSSTKETTTRSISAKRGIELRLWVCSPIPFFSFSREKSARVLLGGETQRSLSLPPAERGAGQRANAVSLPFGFPLFANDDEKSKELSLLSICRAAHHRLQNKRDVFVRRLMSSRVIIYHRRERECGTLLLLFSSSKSSVVGGGEFVKRE